MKKEHEGRVVLITGAASGIGMHTAIEFAKKGASLVVSDIKSDENNQLVNQLSKLNRAPVRFIEADISQYEQVKDLFREIRASEGSLDIAINNAGVIHPASKIAECDIGLAKRCFDVNLWGTYICLKYELMLMQEQRRGVIINVSSVAGIKESAMMAAYGASKHGVIGLTKSAAREYAADGIRINAICPGPIETNMVNHNASPEKLKDILLSRVPMGRLGKPEEIARAISWMCTDECDYMTGHAMVIDGAESA